jgi:predicted Ser/Thr protein kinase
LGKGSFGTVYRGWHDKLQDFVAVKVEQNSNFQLKNEFRILTHLKDKEGFPTVHWFGKIDSSYVMVYQLLGQSLETLKEERKQFDHSSLSFVGA